VFYPGVFSKAAKAIRECETYISTAKEAMALKGVGKGIAAYIEEYLKTGMISKLEEMRAGTA
jgi:DNA polymerase/3'-5' exonuclease PolX